MKQKTNDKALKSQKNINDLYMLTSETSYP